MVFKIALIIVAISSSILKSNSKGPALNELFFLNLAVYTS